MSAQQAMKRNIFKTGFFSDVEVIMLDRDTIVNMWKSAEGRVEASLSILGSAAFPKAQGIEQGYLATARATDFIDKILKDDKGRLRQRIFDENVRDFIGFESEVNNEISETLQNSEKRERFGILNNGVTIIAPDIRVSGFDIFMKDFQIVNGCQTSNVLFQNRPSIGSETTIMMKLVQTSDSAVSEDIVRSTNRQTKVAEEQFLATLESIKAIERYFEARGKDEDYPLYFERRKNQFSLRQNVKAIRVFDIKELARCVAAMFLDRPDLASRYPNRLTGEMRSEVFDSRYQEEIYYVAAFTMYRLQIILRRGLIDQQYLKMRWHILMALKYYIIGGQVPNITSRKIKNYCNQIENFVSGNDEDTVAQINSIVKNIADVEEITRDKLKSSGLVSDVRRNTISTRRKMRRNIRR